MSRPDAVFIHVDFKRGEELEDRVGSVLDIAEPILQVDKANGERAYVRATAHGDFLFVTRDPTCTVFYPKAHQKSGQTRYRWEDKPGTDGKIRIGYLSDQPQQSAPVAVSTDSAEVTATA